MKRALRITAFLAIAATVLFSREANVGRAQTPWHDDGVYMFGRIDNDKTKSGIFGRRRADLKQNDWCVFVGANGKVYKMTLIDRSIRELYIDGKKVDDSLIWKHTAEFKSYLEKYWRDREIEREMADHERQMKPIERRIQGVSQEMEKLDRYEQRLEQSSTGFTEDRKTLSASRKKIAEIERDLSQQIEVLAKQQEKLGSEQESLGLIGDLDNVLKQIGTDLQALGVIKSTAKLSFKLSNVELIVNGQRVSPEVLDLLKARYIVAESGETGFLYRWKGDI